MAKLTPLQKEARKALKLLGPDWKQLTLDDETRLYSVTLSHKTKPWSLIKTNWEDMWTSILGGSQAQVLFASVHEDPLTALFLAKKRARKHIRAIQELIKE
jgi:hypothetical protein